MPTDLRQTIAAAVRAERHRADLTQAQLGARVGWSKDVVNALEAGERVLGLHETPPLCQALGITLAQFLDRAPDARATLGI